jgi:ABC-type spermidine/putrescine transport system permease subunit I
VSSNPSSRIERSSRAATAVLPPVTVLPALVWLLLAIVTPAVIFLVYSFWATDIFGLHKTWNLQQYRMVLGSAFYRSVIRSTLELGLLVAAVCVALAYGTAYAITFSLNRWRTTILLMIVGTALASYLVRIYAWVVILGPRGPINEALEWLGLTSQPVSFLLYSRFAVVVTLVCTLLPFAVLPIYAAMQSIDSDAVRASRDLGAGPVVTFMRIVLPLSWNGVVIAAVLTFVLTVGDYVTPELVGGTSGIMVGRVIYDQFVTRDWALAAALAFSLIAIVVGIVVCLHLVGKVIRRAGWSWKPATASKTALPRSASAALRRIPWAWAYLGCIICFVAAPIVLVIAFSFSSSAFAAFPIRSLSLTWYREALTSDDFRSALVTSLRVALLATVIALVLGIPASFALVRRRFRLRAGTGAAVMLPLSLPGIVIGMGLLTAFTYAGIGLSSSTAVIGQATLALPLVVLVVSARLRGFDRGLEDAGRDLGCSPWKTLRRVTLPIIGPTVIAAGVLTFAMSMDEFVVTNFIIGSSQTLPVLVWALFQRQGISPVVNAIATMLLAGTAIVLAILALLTRVRRYGVPQLGGVRMPERKH